MDGSKAGVNGKTGNEVCCACGGGKKVQGNKVCFDKDFPADDSSLYTK